MSDEKTVRIRVPQHSKIKSDGRGRTTWTDPVETAEFELVSTQMLRRMLDSDDGAARKAIEAVADAEEPGVLARHAEKGTFELIDDAALQEILDSDPGLPKVTRPSDVTLEPLPGDSDTAADELSLVSTQALRKVLGKTTEDQPKTRIEEEPGGGFDPYNSG